MDAQEIRKRITEADPVVIDTAIAIGLTLVGWLLVWGFAQLGPAHPLLPNVRGGRVEALRQPLGFGLAYLLIAATFMPLSIRRRLPWLALAMSALAALVYMIRPGMPPAPVVLGPMVALYTVASEARQRRTSLIALLVAGLVITVPVFAFSSNVRWVADVAGSFVLLAAAVLLGEAERNRREYVAEVEARAVEAERTREEEALRRVDEERIRIARDVHDIVAHSLSIVAVQASAAATLLDTDPDGARESIDNVRATSTGALTELRSMLEVLRTGDSDAPLAPMADMTQLEPLVESVRDAGLDVELDARGDFATVPAYASVSAYRIVQEALTNVMRHANATAVIVAVSVTSEMLSIDVTDDGAGAASDTNATGHGIRGMRERVAALGGTLAAEPLAEGGFWVTARIPLARS